MSAFTILCLVNFLLWVGFVIVAALSHRGIIFKGSVNNGDFGEFMAISVLILVGGFVGAAAFLFFGFFYLIYYIIIGKKPNLEKTNED